MKFLPYLLITVCLCVLIVPVLAETTGDTAIESIRNDTPLPRSYHSTITFDNKMWIIGGEDRNLNTQNDVWSSLDGNNWACANSSAGFPKDTNNRALTYDGRMWVIGSHDVWYSADGKIWTCANISVPPLRNGWDQSAVVFGDRLWIVEGVPVDGSENEYNLASWYSNDGAIWYQANESLPFVMGSRHSLASYNDRMWIFTGNNEVWSSADGIIWDHTGDFPSGYHRKEPIVLVYDNKLWAIGGDETEWLDDAWYSTDGVAWSRAGDSSIINE